MPNYNSNRTWRENNGPSASGKDEKYTYDDLNRLTKMERGNRNGDSVDDKNRAEDFTLDQVGNWKTYKTQQDSGSGLQTEVDHDRAVNHANEITGLTQRTGTWDEPEYDARGNMTTVPKPADLDESYTCAYDAWNRLVEVKDGERVHAKYEYDGLNRRVKAHVDSDSSGGPDTWRHFYYNNEWQLLETRKTTSAENTEPQTLKPERQYVWSVRYLDALILRDENKDDDDDCIDGQDERLYYLTDANMNVTALAEDDGDVLERYLYDPYGNVTFLKADWSLQEVSGHDDGTASAYDNPILFAGYWRDSETGLYHVRNRMYHPSLGLWLQRDPQGYVDGMSLYEYAKSNSVCSADPLGLAAWKLNPKKKWDAKTVKKVKQAIRKRVKEYIKKRKEGYDCADVALTALVQSAAAEGLPLSLPVWDANKSAWKKLRSQSDSYTSVDQYAEAVRKDMGAMSLFDRNRLTRPKDIDKLVGGDLISYNLKYQRDPRYRGHTMNVLDNDPAKGVIRVGEGHLTGPVVESRYTYKDIREKWRGPVEGKGREWNFSVIGQN